MTEQLPPRRPPRRLTRLQQLITQLSKDTGVGVARLNLRLATMMLAGALERATDDTGNGVFALKGGMAMDLRLGNDARMTRDVDLVLRGDVHDLPDLLERVSDGPYAGFEFTIAAPVTHQFHPHVRQTNVKVAFAGRSFVTLVVEIAPIEGAGDVEIVGALPDAGLVGLDAPEVVPVLALRWQIAQKLHAVTQRPADAKRENPRHRDLIDLQLLEPLIDQAELPAIRRACRETFRIRDQHSWPPSIVVYPSWSASYAETAAGTGVAVADVHEAVRRVAALIARIEDTEA